MKYNRGQSLSTSRKWEKGGWAANMKQERAVIWCTRLATRDTERPAKSPVLSKRVWTWMVVSEGVRWSTRWAVTGRKCLAEHQVLTDQEMALIATIYRANGQ
jgi:hypothetical protein